MVTETYYSKWAQKQSNEVFDIQYKYQELTGASIIIYCYKM